MWPWEHLAVGYLCYSLYARARTDAPPNGIETLAVALGTQFPDLVDKPLAWQLGLLSSGNSLAHSAFTAVLLLVFVLGLSKRLGVSQLGVAFAVGYLVHLPGDVFYPLVYGGGPWIEFLWWPFVPVGSGETLGFLPKLSSLLERTGSFLTTPAGRAYLMAELGLLALAVAAWWVDGRPGVGVVRDLLDRSSAGC